MKIAIEESALVSILREHLRIKDENVGLHRLVNDLCTKLKTAEEKQTENQVEKSNPKFEIEIGRENFDLTGAIRNLF